jgi:glucose-1-phosphate adenylyltransferase
MAPLTDVRAKPAMPIAGSYQLIDIPLSNCVHSGLSDVWVVEQFQPQALNDHLANGRPWDLDRTYGGLRIMPPHVGTAEGGWHQGNADAIHRNRRFIREFDPEIVLVLSADHLYTLDYQTAIAAHREQQADVTVVTTRRPIQHASRHAVVVADTQGTITRFAYKPKNPPGDTVAAEIFVYSADPLLDLIDELVARKQAAEGEDASLGDFGDEVLPALVDQGRACAFPLPGYWRDVGTVSSYWTCHIELLDLPHGPARARAADHARPPCLADPYLWGPAYARSYHGDGAYQCKSDRARVPSRRPRRTLRARAGGGGRGRRGGA